ncbi:MAG: hypothetical protein DRP64_00355 [Verrucomicrobia bacterium]|nr:MAG: hypothetical protein DRP64_00355 [Verrucomicrobiota bacterium]
MKKRTTIGAIAGIALLVASSANATVIFDDQFAVPASGGAVWSFAGQPDEALSLNTDIAVRQAGGTITSSYLADHAGGGSGIRTGGAANFQSIFRTVGAGHSAAGEVVYDFGTDVAGKQWSVSVGERKTGGSLAGYTYLTVDSVAGVSGAGIGNGAGQVSIEGYVNGRLDIWINGAEVTVGAPIFGLGLSGRDYVYTLNFDEVAQTVNAVAEVSGNTYDLGIYSIAGVFGSGSRFIEKKNYLPGGATSTDWYVDNLTVDVIPEPATLGMVALLGGGILWIRKRFTI